MWASIMYAYTIRYHEPSTNQIVNLKRDFDHAPAVIFHMIQESGLEVAKDRIVFPSQIIDMKWTKK